MFFHYNPHISDHIQAFLCYRYTPPPKHFYYPFHEFLVCIHTSHLSQSAILEAIICINAARLTYLESPILLECDSD